MLCIGIEQRSGFIIYDECLVCYLNAIVLAIFLSKQGYIS